MIGDVDYRVGVEELSVEIGNGNGGNSWNGFEPDMKQGEGTTRERRERIWGHWVGGQPCFRQATNLLPNPVTVREVSLLP